MKAKIEKNLKKIDLKDYSFLRRLEILNNISRSALLVFFVTIFILSAASIETVQADEGIVNSSTNNTNITNITNSSDEPDSSLSKSEILNSSTQVAN